MSAKRRGFEELMAAADYRAIRLDGLDTPSLKEETELENGPRLNLRPHDSQL